MKRLSFLIWEWFVLNRKDFSCRKCRNLAWKEMIYVVEGFPSTIKTYLRKRRDASISRPRPNSAMPAGSGTLVGGLFGLFGFSPGVPK